MTSLLESGFSLAEQAHEGQDLSRIREEDDSSCKELTASESPSIGIMQDIRRRVIHDFVGSTSFSCSSLRAPGASSEGKVRSESQGIVCSPFEFEVGKPLALPLVYCDFTASHKPLKSIENYLQESCLPFYGNTHTNTSLTGSQSTAFCSEARQIVGEMCGAKITGKASQDVVLFAGSGTTCAVQLLIDCLGLKHTLSPDSETQSGKAHNSKPVIFLGPFEHHSNILPWRELGYVDIETVGLRDGKLDMHDLEALLQKYQQRRVKIGSFSAASNVTGVVVDDIAITALLHKYGALSVWDFATGASYLRVRMNPTDPSYSSSEIAKDAVFFSGHKLLGGVGTPGVLVVKKRLVSQQNPPQLSGGGTVFYVTKDHHRFLSNRIERYEGGTPDILGIWKLGLALSAKQQLTRDFDLALQNQRVDATPKISLSPSINFEFLRARALQKRLEDIPNLILLDGNYNQSADKDRPTKLPVFSFLIKCGLRFLHYNYVCAILNDVFGIQSRGGCQCAGPYAQYLLGLNGKENAAIEDTLVHTKDELLRPGFTRISLPTLGTTAESEEYVLEALSWVARHGWKLLHVYRCNHRTGDWRHKSRPGAPLGKAERKWLSHFRFPNQRGKSNRKDRKEPLALSMAMNTADMILDMVVQDKSSLMQALKMTHEEPASLLSKLRWYVYPKDVAGFLQQGLDQVPQTEVRGALLGAIRPVSLNVSAKEADPWNTGIAISGPNSERKSDLIDEVMFHFRDRDHSGKAPKTEILEGLENGELTDSCHIYNSIGDYWEPILTFAGRVDSVGCAAVGSSIETHDEEKIGNPGHTVASRGDVAAVEEAEEHVEADQLSRSSPSHGPTVCTSMPTKSTLADMAMPSSTNVAAPEFSSSQVLDLDHVFVAKNEAKKPQRDSSTWGQGSVVPLQPVASLGADTSQPLKKSRHKHVRPPAKIMRLVTQATIQWDMLKDGDRLLLGLSGGKDSLSLLHILLEFQKKLPINFEIQVCTIDPLTPSFDPSPLVPYVESLGLKYHYIKDEIVDRANAAGKDGTIVKSLCSYCARMKRGNLYACARKNGCNKLVLAQHLDDLAESFMMSVMHNGFLRTMKANYTINAGDLSVIRPLVYCRESLMTEFAKSANLPVINENCPACFEEPKERARVKKLLSREETLYPNFFDNIRRSILPLMHDDATAILRSYTEELVAKSRKEKKRTAEDKRGLSKEGRNFEDGYRMQSTISSPHQHDDYLRLASDEELLQELARRRADKYRLAGAMKRIGDDPTGQACSLNGGDGTIPCRELME